MHIRHISPAPQNLNNHIYWWTPNRFHDMVFLFTKKTTLVKNQYNGISSLFTDGKNDHEFLVVGGIWGVVTGGTGPRPCLAPDGGNTVGGGGDGEGTPTTSPAPGGVVKL